jgi:hypothetical protein
MILELQGEAPRLLDLVGPELLDLIATGKYNCRYIELALYSAVILLFRHDLYLLLLPVASGHVWLGWGGIVGVVGMLKECVVALTQQQKPGGCQHVTGGDSRCSCVHGVPAFQAHGGLGERR